MVIIWRTLREYVLKLRYLVVLIYSWNPKAMFDYGKVQKKNVKKIKQENKIREENYKEKKFKNIYSKSINYFYVLP